nr:ribosomal protein S3 [Ceramothamnion sp.]
MSQKINPTSFRIGQQLSWNIVHQSYGKKLLNSSLDIFKLGFFLFLFNRLSKYLVSNSFNFCVLPHKFFIVTLLTHLNVTKKKLFLEKHTYCVLTKFKNWYPIESNFLFFVSSNEFCSAQAISFYFNILVKEKIIFRKALLILINLLTSQLQTKKIIYSKFGVKKIKFKGFKVKLTGRFENSKNQMSKNMEHIVGSLSLLSIESYTEFSELNIYSKLGVCNFKIWLFYQ